MKKQTTGKIGEKIAEKFLRTKGFEILLKNYRGNDRTGEIDIVSRDGAILCFVEVKTRQTSDFIDGADTDAWLTRKQALRIENAAKDYLKKIDGTRVQYRFDLIEITLSARLLIKLEHYEGNFGMREY